LHNTDIVLTFGKRLHACMGVSERRAKDNIILAGNLSIQYGFDA